MKIYLPDVSPDLPVHPATGLRAIGIGRRGPIWPVLGGAPDDDADGDDDQDDADGDGDDDQDDAGADQLGDAGKKAIDRMKVKWQRERDARKALEAKIAADNKPKDGDQVDPQKIRDEAKAEATAEALKDRAMDKVEAKAAKLFADPEDAVALLASRVDDFIDDGKVDIDAIVEALEDLIKKKPHLAAQGAKRFGGGADGGARNGSQKPTQVTEAELQKMKPQQIVTARAEGRLNDLLGIS